MNVQPSLWGETLNIRPLQGADLEGLYVAASDPKVWAGHPVKDRFERIVFEPYFAALLASAAAVVVVDNTSGQIIGCSRYYVASDMPEAIAIGFTFLSAAYWGGPANRELKALMLGHAFASFGAVWFHIDPSNRRSQKATQKLGAVWRYDAELDLGAGAAPWKCYELSKAAWAAGAAPEE